MSLFNINISGPTQADLDKLKKEIVMALQDQIAAIVAAEAAEEGAIGQVLALLASQVAVVQGLQAQVATLTGDNPALTSVVSAMQAETAAMAAALPAPVAVASTPTAVGS